MNTLFEKNIAAVKKYYPSLLDKLASCRRNSYEVIFPPENGPPNLLARDNSVQTLYYDPSVDPLTHVRSVFRNAGIETAPFVALFGMGLGYQLLFLYRMLCDAGPLARVICIEKDIACFRMALELFDFAEVLSDHRVKLIIGCSRDELFLACQKHFDSTCYQNAKALRFIPWPAAVSLDIDYYQSAKQALKDVILHWLNLRGNDSYDTLVAYENFFKNLNIYNRHPNVYCLRDLFSKRPAIVIATGPSLNRNIHELEDVQGRAVLLSVDASLKILHQNKVVPHLVTSIERSPGLDNFFNGLSRMEKSVHVVPSFAYPSTISAYKGPRVFMTRPYAFFETLGLKHDMFSMGVSTALAAFETAKLMGCDPIILVGNDLSTAEGGLTHAKGCSFGQKQTAFVRKTFPIPGNNGGTVETCYVWYQNIKDYESKIADYEGLVINATEGGAKIQGTCIMPLKKAIAKYCQSDFSPRRRILTQVARSENQTDFLKMQAPIAMLIENCRVSCARCREGLAFIRPILVELENSTEKISKQLKSRMYAKIEDASKIIEDITTSDLILSVQEYFYPESVPLYLEWQVAKERFSDPAWGDAYRLKLAEDFLGIFGMLCISLKETLENGRCQLNQLLDSKNESAVHQPG